VHGRRAHLQEGISRNNKAKYGVYVTPETCILLLVSPKLTQRACQVTVRLLEKGGSIAAAEKEEKRGFFKSTDQQREGVWSRWLLE